MKDVIAKVAYNRPIAGGYFRLGLSTGWSAFQPGQFIMVKIPDNRVYVRRPFSISKAVDDKTIEIVCKKVGTGTECLSIAKEGDLLQVLGPLGNGFTIPAGFEKALLVAGGFGIAPFVSLSKALKEKGIETLLFFGGRSEEDIIITDEFRGMGVECHITTEDGTLGETGLIIAPLLRYLDKFAPSPCPLPRGERVDTEFIYTGINIYACGPTGLIDAVIKISRERMVPAEISYETYMGCGIGVCLGCAVKTKEGYKRACKEGPVFNVENL